MMEQARAFDCVDDLVCELEDENETLKEQVMRLQTEGKVAKPLAQAIAEFADWHQGQEGWSKPMQEKVSRTLWARVSEEAEIVLGFEIPYPKSFGGRDGQ
jgi:hypothetical protein